MDLAIYSYTLRPTAAVLLTGPDLSHVALQCDPDSLALADETPLGQQTNGGIGSHRRSGVTRPSERAVLWSAVIQARGLDLSFFLGLEISGSPTRPSIVVVTKDLGQSRDSGGASSGAIPGQLLASPEPFVSQPIDRGLTLEVLAGRTSKSPGKGDATEGS